MSIDEIRTQKALALLDFTEAEEALAVLEKERQSTARELQSLAAMLSKSPDGMELAFRENYGHLTPDAIGALLWKLREAKLRLAHAAEKKAQFGL